MSKLDTIPAHAHCEMCQTPVTVGDRRCGDEACEAKFQAALKQKKRGMYMFIGLIVALLVLVKLMQGGLL